MFEIKTKVKFHVSLVSGDQSLGEADSDYCYIGISFNTLVAVVLSGLNF